MDYSQLGDKNNRLMYGNQLYKLRKFNDSSPRIYYPHELLNKFIEYDEHMKENPLHEAVLHQKTGQIIEMPKMRAMTLKGFCLFAGIAQNTFYQYANDESYKPIIQVIADAVYIQKFEGAAAGLLNATLISRDLGLTDVVRHDISDSRKTVDDLFPSIEDINAIEIESTSIEAIEELNEGNDGQANQ